MKVRAQIRLDRDDYQALKAAALARGISVSAAVGWLIRENLSRQDSERREKAEAFLRAAGQIAGKADEGTVSRDHDQYLYGSPKLS